MSLGREMLWWAIRDEDGRGEPTALRPAVRAHFGVPSVTDLVLAIHRGEVAATRLAELVPALFEADSGADAAARAMVDRLAREVAGMARVMLDRSDLLGVRVPVVLAGGVLTSGYERLRAMVTDHLFGQAPLATPELLGCRPVAGALVAALSVLPQAHPGDVAQVARRITVAPDLTSRS